MRAVDRALADLEAGRPWMARDRLVGTAPGASGDPRVLDLLGRVHASMGDVPAAGAAWFLSDRADDDPEVAEALLVLRERYRNPVAAAQAIGVKGKVRAFPPPAQERLRRLQQEVRAAGGWWEPPAAPVAPRRRRGAEADVLEAAHGGRLAAVVGAFGWVLLLALVGVFVVGLVETAGTVADLVGLLL